MPLFGPPDCTELYAKHNIQGLLKALEYKKDPHIQQYAATYLANLNCIVEDPNQKKKIIETMINLPLDPHNGELLRAIYSYYDLNLDPAFRRKMAEYFLRWVKDHTSKDEVIKGIGITASDFIDTDLFKYIKSAIYRMADINDWPRCRTEVLHCLIKCLEKTKNEEFKREIAENFEPLINSGEPKDKMLVAQAYSHIGPAAIPYILNHFTELHPEIQKIYLDSLTKWGWKPETNAIGAVSLIQNGEWDGLIALGETAIEPLYKYINSTGHEYWEHMDAFQTLKSLGKFPCEQPLQQKILQLMTAVLKLPGPVYDDSVPDIGGTRVTMEYFVRQMEEAGVDPKLFNIAAIKKEAKEKFDSEQQKANEVLVTTVQIMGVFCKTDAIPALIDILETKYPEVIINTAFETIKGMKADAVPALLGYLNQGMDCHRMHAIHLLKYIPQEPVIQAIIATVGDKNHNISEAAWSALNAMGSHAPNLIAGMLQHKNKEIRLKAGELLVKISAASTIPAIMKAMESADGDEKVILLASLGSMADPSTFETILACLKDKEAQVVIAACRALAHFKDPRAIEPLVRVLGDPRPSVWEAADKTLDTLGWKAPMDAWGAGYFIQRKNWPKCVKIGEAAIAPLLQGLKSSDEYIAKGSAETLGTIGTSTIIPELLQIMESGDVKIKFELCKTLAHIPDGRSVEPLLNYLTFKEIALRREAARTLITLYKSEVVSPESKQNILEKRPLISAPHSDFDTHTDGSCGFLNYYDHTDNDAIGIEFPL
jgi:HEAT repeat protein